MAVLVEATSVIIRADAVDVKVSGGWPAFQCLIPTHRYCTDGELISIALIDPPDVTAFANTLPPLGLDFNWEGKAVDVTFADQKRGLLTDCNWAEFSQVAIGMAGTGPHVSICRLTGSMLQELRLPEDWQFDGSLTALYGGA